MITTTISCPHCKEAKHVTKHGTTEAGTKRALCSACKKCFAINPKSRAVTPEKEAAILRLLEERITIRGICRAVKCGPQTVYATLKKVEALPAFETSVLPAYKRGEQPKR